MRTNNLPYPLLPMRRTIAILFRCLAVSAMIVALTPATFANFAPRFMGTVTSEAWGVKEIAITHETLTIDLRPLLTADPAGIEVRYELNNSGNAKQLELLFLSGEQHMSEFEAFINDKPVETHILSEKQSADLWSRAPKNWRVPESAPGLSQVEVYFGIRDRAPIVTLSLDLPPGPSTLRVNYRAQACGAAERPTVTWQLPYMLAPAREWGDFGKLDVVVHLPSGWEARSSPELEREGDILHGSFEGVPADALLIATGPPVPAEYQWAVRFSVALWVSVLVGGVVMCWWVGRRLGVARARAANTQESLAMRLGGFALRVFPALLWGALILACFPVSIKMQIASLHGQESPSMTMTSFWIVAPCFFVFIFPFCVLVGIGLTSWSASRSARRVVENTQS
jgi:hypothetical protein